MSFSHLWGTNVPCAQWEILSHIPKIFAIYIFEMIEKTGYLFSEDVQKSKRFMNNFQPDSPNILFSGS